MSIYQKVSNNEKLQMGCMNIYLNSDNPSTHFKEIQESTEPVPIAPKPAAFVQQIPAALGAPAPPAPPIITNQDTTIAVPVNPGNQILQYEKNDEDSFDDIDPLEIEGILQTIEKENSALATQSTVTTTVHQKVKKNPQLPILNNCKIKTINIHIHKD